MDRNTQENSVGSSSGASFGAHIHDTSMQNRKAPMTA